MHETLPFTLSQAQSWRETYPTPFYVYDAAAIRACAENVNKAFAWNKGFREYFAVKATPTPAILRLLRDCGFGADCASTVEVLLAQRCGFAGSHIMFSSNQTLPSEYQAANAAGAIINLDDLTQVENLENACGIPERVCCRYNPGTFEGTNEIMGHLYDSKFGMTHDQLLEALTLLKQKGVKYFGVHAMLTSCALEESYYPQLAKNLFELAVEIQQKLGINLEFINLAGGIGIPYEPKEKEVDIFAVGEGVRQVYEEILVPHGLEPALYAEMGRYITGPYGYLVTSVIGKKHIYKEYIGVDATASCLMRPAIYGAYHHITVLGKELDENTQTVDVVGSLCENNDKFAVDRRLPDVDYGDILVIQDAGAHGHSMGYTYNGKLRCAELMLEDGNVTLIRRAQTAEDYFATLDVDAAFVATGK